LVYKVHAFFEVTVLVPVPSNTNFGAVQIQSQRRIYYGKKTKPTLFSVVTGVLEITTQCHVQDEHNLHIYCCRELTCDDRYFV
jgi:hypothetical protein